MSNWFNEGKAHPWDDLIFSDRLPMVRVSLTKIDAIGWLISDTLKITTEGTRSQVSGTNYAFWANVSGSRSSIMERTNCKEAVTIGLDSVILWDKISMPSLNWNWHFYITVFMKLKFPVPEMGFQDHWPTWKKKNGRDERQKPWKTQEALNHHTHPL